MDLFEVPATEVPEIFTRRSSVTEPEDRISTAHSSSTRPRGRKGKHRLSQATLKGVADGHGGAWQRSCEIGRSTVLNPMGDSEVMLGTDEWARWGYTPAKTSTEDIVLPFAGLAGAAAGEGLEKPHNAPFRRYSVAYSMTFDEMGEEQRREEAKARSKSPKEPPIQLAPQKPTESFRRNSLVRPLWDDFQLPDLSVPHLAPQRAGLSTTMKYNHVKPKLHTMNAAQRSRALEASPARAALSPRVAPVAAKPAPPSISMRGLEDLQKKVTKLSNEQLKKSLNESFRDIQRHQRRSVITNGPLAAAATASRTYNKPIPQNKPIQLESLQRTDRKLGEISELYKEDVNTSRQRSPRPLQHDLLATAAATTKSKKPEVELLQHLKSPLRPSQPSARVETSNDLATGIADEDDEPERTASPEFGSDEWFTRILGKESKYNNRIAVPRRPTDRPVRGRIRGFTRRQQHASAASGSDSTLSPLESLFVKAVEAEGSPIDIAIMFLRMKMQGSAKPAASDNGKSYSDRKHIEPTVPSKSPMHVHQSIARTVHERLASRVSLHDDYADDEFLAECEPPKPTLVEAAVNTEEATHAPHIDECTQTSPEADPAAEKLAQQKNADVHLAYAMTAVSKLTDVDLQSLASITSPTAVQQALAVALCFLLSSTSPGWQGLQRLLGKAQAAQRIACINPMQIDHSSRQAAMTALKDHAQALFDGAQKEYTSFLHSLTGSKSRDASSSASDGIVPIRHASMTPTHTFVAGVLAEWAFAQASWLGIPGHSDVVFAVPTTSFTTARDSAREEDAHINEHISDTGTPSSSHSVAAQVSASLSSAFKQSKRRSRLSSGGEADKTTATTTITTATTTATTAHSPATGVVRKQEETASTSTPQLPAATSTTSDAVNTSASPRVPRLPEGLSRADGDNTVIESSQG